MSDSKPVIEGETFSEGSRLSGGKRKEVPDKTSKHELASSKKKRLPAAEPCDISKYGVFDPKSIINFASIIVYGARRIGKTHLVSWILSVIGKRFKKAYLFSGTADVQPNAWDFIDEDCKFSSFNEVALNRIFDEQDEKITPIRRRWEMNGKKGDVEKMINKEVPHVLLVLDDIVSDPRVQRSGILNKVFTLGRHRRITIIILSQNACASGSVSLHARGNVDYCISSMMNSLADWERLAEYYFGQEGKNEGIELLKAMTEQPYHFAVAELHKQGRRKLSDYCSYISAPAKIGKFKIAQKDVWKDSRYCTTSEDKVKKYNVGYNGVKISKDTLVKLVQSSNKDMCIRNSEVGSIFGISSHMF